MRHLRVEHPVFHLSFESHQFAATSLTKGLSLVKFIRCSHTGYPMYTGLTVLSISRIVSKDSLHVLLLLKEILYLCKAQAPPIPHFTLLCRCCWLAFQGSELDGPYGREILIMVCCLVQPGLTKSSKTEQSCLTDMSGHLSSRAHQ